MYFTARADAGAENPSVTTQLRVAWAQREEREMFRSAESLSWQLRRNTDTGDSEYCTPRQG